MTDTTFWRISEDARINAQAEDAHMEHLRMRVDAVGEINRKANHYIISMAQKMRFYRAAKKCGCENAKHH